MPTLANRPANPASNRRRLSLGGAHDVRTGQLDEMNGCCPCYRLSKVSLNALTRIFADELRETGVKVNAVCPG